LAEKQKADADSDDKKDSGGLGAIGKNFDQYEYVAVITPGAALLIGILLLWHDNVPLDASKETGLGALGLFLVAAFVAGQILQAIGESLARIMWRCCGGMPSEWVLLKDPPSPLLDPDQKQELSTRIKELWNVDFEKLTVETKDPKRAEKFDEWQAVTRRINIKVANAHKGGRINAFNRTYGMMIGLTVAILFVAVFLLKRIPFAGAGPLKAGVLCLLAFAIAGFMLHRAYVFGKLYARELFVSFLEVTKTK
jgi:hypothetical protein